MNGFNLYKKYDNEIVSPIELFQASLRRSLFFFRQFQNQLQIGSIHLVHDTLFEIRKIFLAWQGSLLEAGEAPPERVKETMYFVRYCVAIDKGVSDLGNNLDPVLAEAIIDSLQDMLKSIEGVLMNNADNELAEVPFPPIFNFSSYKKKKVLDL